MIEVCSWCKCESFLVQTFTRLNGRHGAFLSGSNIRVETGSDHPDERPALLRDPDDFVTHLNRHSPDDIQNRGNRTTGPPPRELYPFRSHPIA